MRGRVHMKPAGIDVRWAGGVMPVSLEGHTVGMAMLS